MEPSMNPWLLNHKYVVPNVTLSKVYVNTGIA